MKRRYAMLTAMQRVRVYQEVSKILNEGRKPSIGRLVDEVKLATGFENITYGNLHKILKRMFKKRYNSRRRDAIKPAVEVPLNVPVDTTTSEDGQMAWTFSDPKYKFKVGEIHVQYQQSEQLLEHIIQLSETALKMLKQMGGKSA